MTRLTPFAVYIMTNSRNTVLYTGVTNDLYRRVLEHRRRDSKRSFTARYKIWKLVWYEMYSDIRYAIQREKQIKGGSRNKKIELIKSLNPQWKDMADDVPRC